MSVEGASPAVRAGGSGLCGGIGDVIALRHAGRRDRRATGAIAFRRLLGGGASFGDPAGVVGGLLDLDVGGGPALLELHARRRMAVDFVRPALAPASGADGTTFPPRFG